MTSRREGIRIDAEERKTHRHSTNPFTDGWQPDTVTRNKRVDLDKRPVFDENGERVGGKLLVPYERDCTRFIKVVWDSLGDLARLSRTASRTFFFACHQALPGNAIVRLNPEDGMDFCKFATKASFYEGITELVAYQFLARTEKKGYYYLNPQIFFNGNRSKIKNVFTKVKE